MFKLRPSRPLIIASLPALSFIVITLIIIAAQSDKRIDLPGLGISAVYPNRITWDYFYREKDDTHILYKKRPWFNFWSDKSNEFIEISAEECNSENCTAKALLDEHIDKWPTLGEDNLNRTFWLHNVESLDSQPISGCNVEAVYFSLSAIGIRMPANAIALECDKGNLIVMGYGFRTGRDQIIKVTSELAQSIRLLD